MTAPKPARSIPAFCHGQRWLAPQQQPLETFGGEVRLPLADERFAAALAAGGDNLAQMPIDAILGFLKNVGRSWRSRDYVRRQLYVRALQEHKGYSERMAQNEADWIALLLCSDYRIYDTLTVELGSWHVLDDWMPREECHVRALPRGQVLHILPGNVPLSAIVSLLRAIVTKNRSLLKLSSEDPFTPTALVQSFCDIDQNHPVTRSVSSIYWPAEAEIGGRIARQSDVVIAWGGQAAIDWARAHVSAEAELIAFGPKRSLGLVGAGRDPARVAEAAAVDISLYDQKACFSLRQIFVESSVAEAFTTALADALNRFGEIVPAGRMAPDEAADISLTYLEWMFAGALTVSGDRWRVVTCAPDQVSRHCLGRTVFVHPVAELSQALRYIDRSVQTVGIAPWERGRDLRDVLAARGVSRIVELGMHNIFRVGGAHDGMFPLQRLVRWVSHESGAGRLVKGINVRIDQTEFLKNDRLLEFVP
jgi:long-chain-fatty-acyl-CoA reductase